jgi:hypothetical protein
VKSALVSRLLLVGLLGVNLVDRLGGYSCRVEEDSVEGGGRALLADLSRDLEVPDGRSTGRPGGAEDLVRFTVQVTKVGRGRISREQKNGFLNENG